MVMVVVKFTTPRYFCAIRIWKRKKWGDRCVAPFAGGGGWVVNMSPLLLLVILASFVARGVAKVHLYPHLCDVECRTPNVYICPIGIVDMVKKVRP